MCTYLGDTTGVEEEGADPLAANEGGRVQHSQLVPVQVQHRRVHRDQGRDRSMGPEVRQDLVNQCAADPDPGSGAFLTPGSGIVLTNIGMRVGIAPYDLQSDRILLTNIGIRVGIVPMGLAVRQDLIN